MTVKDERTLVAIAGSETADKEIESDLTATTYRVRATIVDKKTGEKRVEIHNLTAEQLSELEAAGARVSDKNAAIIAAHRKKS